MLTRRPVSFRHTACPRVAAVAPPVVLLLLLLLLAGTPAAAQEPPPAAETKPPGVLALPQVTVIGTTPLAGLGIPVEQYPGNVQSLTADDLATQHLLDLSDIFYRRLGSVPGEQARLVGQIKYLAPNTVF